MNSDEFYLLRDDRTRLIADVRDFREQTVSVVVGQSAAESPAGQLTFLALVNLLARFVRRVVVVTPDAQLLWPQFAQNRLLDAAFQCARASDPFVDIGATFRPGVSYTISIDDPVDANLYCAGEGWRAVAGKRPFAWGWSADANPTGPILAAAVACAEAFKDVAGQGRALHSVALDIPSLVGALGVPEHIPNIIDVGRILQVGAGAVGSAFDWTLGFAALRGTLDVIDRDRVEIHNLNRSPAFAFDHAHIPDERDGTAKVSVAEQHLTKSGLVVNAFDEWFHERYTSRPASYDLWLPLANEYGVRHSMQEMLPPPMFHATTTPSWGVNLHRHDLGDDDCLTCRIPSEPRELVFKCTTGAMDAKSGVPPDAALPFQSTAAGVLLAAVVLIASATGRLLPNNYAELNFRSSDLDAIRMFRRCKRDCTWSDRIELARRFNSGSRYLV